MASAYKTYRVTVTPLEYISGRSNTPEEIDRDFVARTAAEAISEARAYMRDYCWGSGKMKYSAKKITK